MPPTLHCQHITPEQHEVFSAVIQAVAQELEDLGDRLWDQSHLSSEWLAGHYGLESLYLAWVNAEPVATFVLIEDDPLFWPEVTKGESLFIHKVAVARAWKGHDLSRQILDFAVGEVQARGKRFLRLDTDATRPALCKLYERYGFCWTERRLLDGFDCALYELEVDV